MQFGMKIPVFVVNGFLESGKTVFALDTIGDEYFTDGEDTLIIACEEGMEEYEEEFLSEHDTKIVYCESKEDFTEEFLKQVFKRQIQDCGNEIIVCNGYLNDRALNRMNAFFS